MSLQMIRQTSFNMGEVDPNNFKRTESADYLSAAQSMLNMNVSTTGLAKKRAGTKFLLDVTAYASNYAQIFEYQDKFNNYYLIMATNLKLDIFRINAMSGAITFHQTVGTPYVQADLNDIDYALSNDVLVFSHGSYQPARLFIGNYSLFTFVYEPIVFFPYPAVDFQQIDYNNFTVFLNPGSGNILDFQFRNLGPNPGYDNTWIGGQIIGPAPNGGIASAIINTVTYFPLSNGGTVRFLATMQQPFETTAGSYPVLGSYYAIKQPSWSNALGWPKKVLFYQNRLWFANTDNLNNTIFGSKINSFANFDVGIGRDTDAIIYNLGQSDTGGIQWLNGGKQLEIYTQNYEFVCTQDQNTALTPSTFAIRQQSSYGVSSSFKPLTYINDSYYVSRTGKSIINFKFEGIGLSYHATNISAQCEHLVNDPIDRAIAKGDTASQDNFIFFLNADRTITTFQFAYEYKLSALTPMDFQRDGGNLLTEDGEIILTEDGQPIQVDESTPTVEVINIVNINNKIYFLKYYTLNGNYALEVFDDNFKIDSYITSTMNSAGLITGLDVLNNYVVDVIVNGEDFGSYTVIGGQVAVDNPDSVTGTAQVGMLFDVILTPMYIFSGASKSNFYKTISLIYVDYYNSLDFRINDTIVPYQTYNNIQNSNGLVPQSDTAVVPYVGGWNRFATFSITQRSPFDLQITAIAYEIEDALI